MSAHLDEINAEARGRRGAERIDESLLENQISSRIIDAAIEVHRASSQFRTNSIERWLV